MRKPWKCTEKQIRRHLRGRYKGSGVYLIALHLDQSFSNRSQRNYNKRELFRLINGWKDEGHFKDNHFHDLLYNYW